MVHDPFDYPLIEESGMALMPGTESFLALKEIRVG